MKKKTHHVRNDSRRSPDLMRRPKADDVVFDLFFFCWSVGSLPILILLPVYTCWPSKHTEVWSLSKIGKREYVIIRVCYNKQKKSGRKSPKLMWVALLVSESLKWWYKSRTNSRKKRVLLWKTQPFFSWIRQFEFVLECLMIRPVR